MINEFSFLQGKLDGYKSQYESGKELNDDQKSAIAKYDEVMQSLDFARELSGQFKGLAIDEEKNKKKQLKKEQLERTKSEIGHLATILGARQVLQAFTLSKVRADFTSGENGALKLTKDQFAMIDDFSKLVSISLKNLDETDKVLNPVAEHLVSLAECKPKKVGKTTYKDLMALITTIRATGYFKTNNLEGEAAEASQKKEKAGRGNRDKKHHNGKVSEKEEKAPVDPSTVQPHAAQPHQPSPQRHTVASPEKKDPPQVMNKPVVPMPTGNMTAPTTSNVFPPPPNLAFVPPVTSGIQHHPHVSQPQQQPPINFLQDSQIDMQSPHMDPAVVVVQSTPPTTNGTEVPPPPMTLHNNTANYFITPTTLAAAMQHQAAVAAQQHQQHFGGHFQAPAHQPQPQQHKPVGGAPGFPMGNHVPPPQVQPQQQVIPEQQPSSPEQSPAQVEKTQEVAVDIVETPQQQEPQAKPVAAANPPGYAAIAAAGSRPDHQVVNTMATIDSWNNDEGVNDDSAGEQGQRHRGGGRGGNRGRGGRGGNRDRDGRDRRDGRDGRGRGRGGKYSLMSTVICKD